MKHPFSSHLGLGLALVGALGARFDASAVTGTPIAKSFDAAKSHWAYQPIQRPETPLVKAASEVRTPVDAFLLARLESKGLGFSAPADPRTLLRRLYFDLVGLPPSYEETMAFDRDPSDTAYRAVVEKLLASPGYGERWGRHWLDVARYADTKDLVLLYGRDAIRPWAYTYRDYVIRALNEDLPFDQFVTDQLAADLEQPSVAPWRLAALGFLTLGRLFDHNPHDQIDDQIDTVSRGLMGLTVACARCHDHKYDAVTMSDYYGLYGVFASTERPYDLPLIEDPAKVPGGIEFEAKMGKARDELEKHIDAEYARMSEILRRRFGDYLVRAATTTPDLTETAQFGLSLTPDDFRPALVQNMRRFLARRVTPGDPVFGPWSALMALDDARFEAESGPLLKELAARSGTSTTPFSGAVLAGLGQGPLTRKDDVARIYARVVTHHYESWRTRSAGKDGVAETREERELRELVTAEGSPMWFARRDTPDHMSRAEKDKYGGLALALDKLAAHASNRPPARAMVLRDLPRPHEPRIFLRGSPARPGEVVSRGSLRLLNGGREKPFTGEGSGRLELARSIASADNPLTARVMVNRVWMEHFGEPLVGTPADFGTRSERPSHPELLDWLADEFRRGGWSWKNLHRQIVLSSAFRQGSGQLAKGIPAVLAAEDPDNHWLGRFARRRLDLEAMRDAMLHVSGRLDPSLAGRPEDVAGDPLNRRRTVYGLVDRQNLPGLFRSFDFATPDQCVERRPRTTVAQQALFAMNSAFIAEQARALVARPEVAEAGTTSARIESLFRRVLGRWPTDLETTRAARFLREASAAGEAGQSPVEQLAQVLLAGNEFVFVD